MAKMRLAAAAQHLGAPHEEAAISLGVDAILGDRLIEARPACAAIEFRLRGEELLAAADAGIGAGAMLVPIFAGESALGAFLARDAELLGRKLCLPFRIGFLGLVLAHRRVSFSR